MRKAELTRLLNSISIYSTPTARPRLSAFLTGLMLILLGMSASLGAEPLSLGEDIFYSLLVDAEGSLTFAQAEQALRDEPIAIQTTLSRGYTRDTFWLRFELPQRLFNHKDRWLELGPNYLDDVQLFFREQGVDSQWHIRKTGDLLYGASDLDYRNPVFLLSAPSANAEGYEVIIRVRTSSTVILSAQLWTPEEFLGHATRSASFWSFYFGLAVLSSLLALILAIVLRTPLLWSATAFSATYLFVASIQGYINWVFPPFGFPIQHYATGALTLISFALLMWMSSETLNLRKLLPWAHKALIRSCVTTLFLVALIPFDLYRLAVSLTTLILFFTYALFIYAVFHIWVREKFPITTLALGISPMVCIVASLFGIFSIFGWIPFQENVYLVWQYSVVVNMLLVLAVGVYRIREKKLEEFEKQMLANELKAEREASFHQRQFMGTVSHEFRTPLAIISGALENLRYLDDDESSPRLSRYRKIERASDRLTYLTDNCLADARLSADSTSLDLQPTDLMQLVTSAASLVHLSDTHKLVITMDGQPVSTPAPVLMIEADQAMMRIAISNVIDNAVKYSDNGEINIDCCRAGSTFLVRICDEGPGIGDLNAEALFQRYRRGTSKKQGSGLGLFVAQQIAQASGGDLQFIGNTTKGSCFEFTLNHAETGLISDERVQTEHSNH